MKVQQIYQVTEESSFSNEHDTPYTLIVAETYQLAYDYIKNIVWKYTNDTWDTWDVISNHVDNFVRLKRRKTGEEITLQIDFISIIKK